MSTDAEDRFAKKQEWHESQRSLSPKEKVRILLALQRRELEANRIREALGRPTRRMKVWDIEP